MVVRWSAHGQGVGVFAYRNAQSERIRFELARIEDHGRCVPVGSKYPSGLHPSVVDLLKDKSCAGTDLVPVRIFGPDDHGVTVDSCSRPKRVVLDDVAGWGQYLLALLDLADLRVCRESTDEHEKNGHPRDPGLLHCTSTNPVLPDPLQLGKSHFLLLLYLIFLPRNLLVL